VGETISVAASDLSTKFNATCFGDREGYYSYSNLGSCVDIFAPGVDVYAACGGTNRCAEVNDTRCIPLSPTKTTRTTGNDQLMRLLTETESWVCGTSNVLSQA